MIISTERGDKGVQITYSIQNQERAAQLAIKMQS